ncbi:hypothetical protein [Amycolatopsis suaedae]|uniref:Uncharacterized protein n=1 Tax=Amycolatopsis suaedae TaxID=2510978 RepID=A0A4Q7J6V2_9PSEU|nr:hypothetical protein [Amycolatopsis suaedae]RZQ63381.1 hypothetical protein EWH70_13080 [Amycolatopsis suaedae]
MPEKYGTHEKAALFILTLENREVPNPELTKDYGVDLRPAGRDKLIGAGLLNTWKENRRLVHRVTEAGIAWCDSELDKLETPQRQGPLARVMFELLRRMVPVLRQHGVRLADLVAPADLEALIRGAYHELSVGPQDWVRLAKVRSKLDGADRGEVDEVLLSMTRTGLVHLAPISNRKTLTEADHAAAIRIGSEDKHLLAIEES